MWLLGERFEVLSILSNCVLSFILKFSILSDFPVQFLFVFFSVMTIRTVHCLMVLQLMPDSSLNVLTKGKRN